MDGELLQRLTRATTDAERAAIVLEMSLAALPLALQEVVLVAAIPHWFDAQFLDALLGEESDAYYDPLLTLSFVEQSPGRGYAIHERTRQQLLRALWQTDPARFRVLSGLAADYCAAQAASTDAAAWQAEAIYHRLVSDPQTGVAGLRDLATRWANYEYHTYDEIEGTLRLAQEQIDAGRLTGSGAAWAHLWQAKLALLYGRPDLAAAPLAELTAASDDDPILAAETAQTLGDLQAQSGDRAGMATAWQTAYDLYQQRDGQNGQLDAYLLAEKMGQYGLLLPEAEAVAEDTPAVPATGDDLRLIDNIAVAWIDGVLKVAVNKTMDLKLARDGGQPTNLVFHRPQAVDRPLAAGQRLSRLLAAAGGALLILGAPGSGKTITLLQLLDELLQQARADSRAPIPLLFNLSSFAAFARDKDVLLTDWLVEEAYRQYRLKRETTRERLAAGDRFVLLLDGLDEVSNEAGQRERCITAINEFMRQTPGGLVVCSRIRDYQTLHNRLALAHALVLQPLSNRQIETFVRQMDSPHSAAMQARIKTDWQLREALRSPLLLNLYPQAFAALPAAESGATVEARRQALFAAYVETVFDQPLPADDPLKGDVGGKEESIRWLSFMAGRMRQLGSSIFFVEALQPMWLPQELIGSYRGRYGFYLGLIAGLIVGLISGLVVPQEDMPGGDLFVGLFVGLFFGLVFGLSGGAVIRFTTRLQKPWLRAAIGGLGGVFLLTSGLGVMLTLGMGSLALDIQLRERIRLLRPNRQRVFHYLRRGIRLGLIFGLISVLILGLISVLILGWPAVSSSESFPVLALLGIGLVVVLTVVLIGGLGSFVMALMDTPAVDKRPYPGSGVRASLRNALLMTTFAALVFGLPSWSIGQRLIEPRFLPSVILSNILPPVFAWFGGLAWCQHRALRAVLARQGWLPRRLVPWLDSMVARGLLRRVGGGYIFIHRSLLEYFAALEGEPTLPKANAT